jgi:hypothetical protein
MFFMAMTFSGFGQHEDQKKIAALFSKSQKFYENNPQFKLDLEYKLFPTSVSVTVSEKYSGQLIKHNGNSYSRIGSTEFIQIKSEYIKIDNDSKLVQITKKDDVVPDEVYNLGNLLNNFNDFKLKSDAQYWVCTLTAPEISFVPYGKAIIYINKKDYSVARQILFLLHKTEYKNEKGKKISDYPRMEISIGNLQAPTAKMVEKLRMENYISRSNNTFKLSNNYSGYKIVD